MRKQALNMRKQQQSNDVEYVLEIENFADANGNGTNKENGKEKEFGEENDIASDEEIILGDDSIVRKMLDADLIMAKRKKV